MSDKKPLVSIIMNCFNGEKYLLQSINSVLEQKYKNWELIFWDNKSTDNSKKIFQSKNDSRFKYFYSEDHTSLYKARNLAIEKTSGDYLTFLDTDDYWLPNKLMDQINLINEKNPGVIYGNLWVYSDQKNKKKILFKKKLYEGNIFNKLVEDYSIGITTVMIKKTLFLEIDKKFDERFNHIGDFDLIIRLSKITSFAALQYPTAVFRAHGNNLSTLDKMGSIKELELWLGENSKRLSSQQVDCIQKRIDSGKIIYLKLNGRYIDPFKLVFKKRKNITLKNLITVVLPSFLLKKILWY